MSNRGRSAQSGFILLSIVALLESLERDDWDEIKFEPNMTFDIVDFMLYKDGNILCTIKVKASTNPFKISDVRTWLDKLRVNAGSTEEILLYLVSDTNTPVYEAFIAEHRNEIKQVPFENIQTICTSKLVEYIRKSGFGEEITLEKLNLIYDYLFSKMIRSSISQEPISRVLFESVFQRQLLINIDSKNLSIIPQCLTPIPRSNHNECLIGREDIVTTVKELLEVNGYPVLLKGIAGIGKTSVMKYVCNVLKSEGKYVAWLEWEESLQNILLQLRNNLGVSIKEKGESFEKVLITIKAQLAGELYLFIDNLTRNLRQSEVDLLNSLGIHVMATARFDCSYFVNISLGVLQKQAALDMFYWYYRCDPNRKYEKTAWNIIETVQSHTLLIELLAKAAWNADGTLDDFLGVLKDKGFFDMSSRYAWMEHDSAFRTIEQNETKLIEMSGLSGIEQFISKLYDSSGLSFNEQHIMKLFTIFTPGEEIFYKIVDWADLDKESMNNLVKYGWLERGGLENGYFIHDIVKNSIALQMTMHAESVNIFDYGNLLHKVLDTENYLSAVVPHYLKKERLVLLEDIASFISYRIGFDADHLSSDDNYSEDVYNMAELINDIAIVFEGQDDYEKALEYCKKALSICVRLYGTNSFSTATIYNNIARAYNFQGEYDKALDYCYKAISIYNELCKTDNLHLADAYNNIGLVYKEQGNYNSALEYYGKTLSIRKHILGVDHPDTADTYNNMALVYENQNDYAMALEYYGKALAICDHVLGVDHPMVATIYNNIAIVYSKQCNYDMALEYYFKALYIRGRVLGPKHPLTATTYNNIGTVCLAQGESMKALEYFEKAYEIYSLVLGEKHQDTVKISSIIADIDEKRSEYEKAL